MIWGDGFEIETLLNCRFFLRGHRIVEVPSVELSRIYGTSNLNAVSDGLRVLRTILAERALGTNVQSEPIHESIDEDEAAAMGSVRKAA